MENQNRMQPGTWERVNTDVDNREKVRFEVNIPLKITIKNPLPKEVAGEDGGVYYVFEVTQDGVEKIIQTSAWTLLKEMKRIGLKAGMNLEITKKLEKGKQYFTARIV